MADTTYATLAELKTRLGITGSDQDTYLQLVLNATAGQVDAITNSTFVETDLTAEKHSGYGNRVIQLRHLPVLSVAEVRISDSAIASTSYELNHLGCLIRPEDGEYNPRTRVEGDVWPCGTNIIEVDYSYGYADLPPPVYLATLLLAAHNYKQQITYGVSAESYEGRSITYDKTACPPGIMAMLSGYVQRVIGG